MVDRLFVEMTMGRKAKTNNNRKIIHFHEHRLHTRIPLGS